MTKDAVLEFAVELLVREQGCHTVILYGSRARGDWTEESDYDLAGFRKGGETIRDAREFEGKFLDLFVEPEEAVAAKEYELLKLRGGRVLVENEGFGARLLSRLDEVFAQGPPAKPDWELKVIRVWIDKMLQRIQRGDLEAGYRRSWLEYALLEDYFALRRSWYLGPKAAFAWLRENDPETLLAFERALRPGAPFEELARLSERVRTISSSGPAAPRSGEP